MLAAQVNLGNRFFERTTISWTADSKWILARDIYRSVDLIEVDTGLIVPLPFAASYVSVSLK
jgi:hypothetical protein